MMLPVKPSVDSHIHLAQGQAAGLHIASEVNRGLLEQRQYIQLELGALVLLGADVHQAHPGFLDALHLFHIGAAHQCKLQEHLRAAIVVRAGIHQQVTGAVRWAPRCRWQCGARPLHA